MRNREVPESEIVEGFITFCKDLGVVGDTADEINKDIENKDLHIQKNEDVNLIWFEQIENDEVKYYSEPILKYIPEPEKENKFYVQSDGPISMLRLPTSSMPLYHYRKLRKGKIPPAEEKRDEQEREIDDYKRHIYWAYDCSVFGYILFDGKGILYPKSTDGVTIVYKGDLPDTSSYYKNAELLKKLLSDKNKYTWYELGDKYFIVQNSTKKEYQYLADEITQEIKLAKIVGETLVLEDIVKDDLTLKVERELDANLKKSKSIGSRGSYIRFSNNSFGIVKTQNIPVKVDNNMFPLFASQKYRTECSYQNVETSLTYAEISQVIKSGTKYKWFEHHGKLYISSAFGDSNKKIIMGDFASDTTECAKCLFNYKNSPYHLVMAFITEGLFDGDEIMKRYKCGQESIDRIVKDLIYYKMIEPNCEKYENKYKLVMNRADFETIFSCIERLLKL